MNRKSVAKSDDNNINKEDNHKIVFESDWVANSDGTEYRIIRKEREVPRKTYIKAFLKGKYRGEIDESYSNQFSRSEFYNFNIYDCTLTNATYQKDKPYILDEDYKIPRECLPKLIYTILKKDNLNFEINLHEPTFSNIYLDRKLHQTGDNYIYGTIEATVSGYILDFVKEEYEVIEYRIPQIETTIGEVTDPLPVKTKIPTGNIETNGNYKRIEYYYSDYKQTYWGEWKYTNPVIETGCLSSILGIISFIVMGIFIIMLFPYLVPIFLILIGLFILSLIPPIVYNWIFRIIGGVFLVLFITSLLQSITKSSVRQVPTPTFTDTPEETKPQAIPIVDTLNKVYFIDTLITHHKSWQDYDGKKYKGRFWVRKSDYSQSSKYKRYYSNPVNTEDDYDYLIYSLKENDKYRLNGVYAMFDSLRYTNLMSEVKFAELIVTFVQSIPYSVILPYDCNPDLYEDYFIKEYLSMADAKCAGFERFGINTPVEFIASLSGDCDTRTLLLYTILAHYNYDVALFSSEHYSHSIIGVNLPINGVAYKYKNQRYVLWETTAANIKPGIIPMEISNLNYWRISLKSK